MFAVSAPQVYGIFVTAAQAKTQWTQSACEAAQARQGSLQTPALGLCIHTLVWGAGGVRKAQAEYGASLCTNTDQAASPDVATSGTWPTHHLGMAVLSCWSHRSLSDRCDLQSLILSPCRGATGGGNRAHLWGWWTPGSPPSFPRHTALCAPEHSCLYGDKGNGEVPLRRGNGIPHPRKFCFPKEKGK